MEPSSEAISTLLCNYIPYPSIHTNVFIGNNCVLHTAASTTSGLPATLEIQDDCVVQSGCTLYSCLLKEKAYIGHNSVVL